MSSSMFLTSNTPPNEHPCPSDLYTDTGDGEFWLFSTERVPELKTEKKYFACLSQDFTPERAQKLIEYLRRQLETAGEIELWHVWRDNAFDHRVKKRVVPIDELTAEDITQFCAIKVCKQPPVERIGAFEWEKPVTDYCLVVYK